MVHSGHELGVPTPTAPLGGAVRLPILHSGPGLRLAASDGEPIPTASADPDRLLGSVSAPLTVLDQEGLEVDVPNVARIYDALLGGKDNWAADRLAAAKLVEAVPGAAVAARENRAFLGRAVRFLAEDAGVHQFLDIGAGLPTARAVHEIAQDGDPRQARVVYADYDRVVVRHARAILGDSLTAAVVRGDMREPWDLFARPTVRSLINLAEPVAILLVAVLHFVEDHEDPWAVVNCYKDLMAPGSYLVISHVTADHLSEDAARQARAAYDGASAPGVARTRDQIAGFFAGLDMVAPGLVDVSEWRPDVIGAPPGPAVFYAGIGCKTRPGRPR